MEITWILTKTVSIWYNECVAPFSGACVSIKEQSAQHVHNFSLKLLIKEPTSADCEVTTTL